MCTGSSSENEFLVSTQVIFDCLLVHRCIDDVTIDGSKVELIWYLSLNVSHRSGNIARSTQFARGHCSTERHTLSLVSARLSLSMRQVHFQ